VQSFESPAVKEPELLGTRDSAATRDRLEFVIAISIHAYIAGGSTISYGDGHVLELDAWAPAAVLLSSHRVTALIDRLKSRKMTIQLLASALVRLCSFDRAY